MTKFDATLVEDFELATEAEASEYIALLEQALGDQWDYTPKQEFAEILWGKVDWLLYGGAAGGGKSDFACNHLVRVSQRYPGAHTLVIRQSIPELRRSLILRLIARQRQFDYPYTYRKREGTPMFEFDNGSIIECGHCQTDEDLGKYLSAEYLGIIIDEASQLTPEQIMSLQARLRITVKFAAKGARTHLGLFTNPGDRAHAWLYKTFVAPTDYGNRIVVYDLSGGIEKIAPVKVYEAPIDVRTATVDDLYDTLIPWAEALEVDYDQETQIAVAFVQAKVTDNPHVPTSYLKNLRALPERKRRQMLDGDWDTFEGQFFHEFARDLHVVERADEFPIPSGWVRAIGLDWGEAKPYAAVWCAWDEDGDAWIYRCDYGAGYQTTEQAERVTKRSTMLDDNDKVVPERFQARVADPSVFARRRGMGRSIADQWRDGGLRVTRANNERIHGWQNLRNYLWDPTHVHDDGTRGRPRLHIFASCDELLDELVNAQYAKSAPEDMDTTGADHALDALRYVLMVRPMERRKPIEKITDAMELRRAKLVKKVERKRTSRRYG